jgi:hypothetical protein
MAKSTEKAGGKTKKVAKKANYQTAHNKKSGNRMRTYNFRKMVKCVESIMEDEGSDPQFKVTRKLDDGTNIGKWVADIRSAYRAIQKGEKPNRSLLPYQIELLNKINFMWHEERAHKNRHRSKSQIQKERERTSIDVKESRNFIQQCSKLRAFSNENKHFNVPESNPLGKWWKEVKDKILQDELPQEHKLLLDRLKIPVINKEWSIKFFQFIGLSDPREVLEDESHELHPWVEYTKRLIAQNALTPEEVELLSGLGVKVEEEIEVATANEGSQSLQVSEPVVAEGTNTNESSRSLSVPKQIVLEGTNTNESSQTSSEDLNSAFDKDSSSDSASMTIDGNTAPPDDLRPPPTHPVNGKGKSLPTLIMDARGVLPVTSCDVCEKIDTQHYCLRRVISTARYELLQGNRSEGYICGLATCHECRLSKGVESSNRCVECYTTKTTEDLKKMKPEDLEKMKPEDLEKMKPEELKELIRSNNITIDSRAANPQKKTLLKAVKFYYGL